MASSFNAATRPSTGSTDENAANAPAVFEHDHVTRLDVRRGVLDQAEVVAGGVVQAAGR
jgi:hypothetical protein